MSNITLSLCYEKKHDKIIEVEITMEAILKKYPNAIELKTQYNNHIILFRLGAEFACFNNDAILLSQILNTKLINNVTSFHYEYLEDYLTKIVKMGHKLAMIDLTKN